MYVSVATRSTGRNFDFKNLKKITDVHQLIREAEFVGQLPSCYSGLSRARDRSKNVVFPSFLDVFGTFRVLTLSRSGLQQQGWYHSIQRAKIH